MSQITNTAEEPHLEWLFGQNPNAIEAQEAQGQKELVASSQLPTDINTPFRMKFEEVYAKMGIKVVGKSDRDPIFVSVILPTGWTKKSTDHSMWSRLVDDKGRERADIFYKAAFYDRSAHLDVTPRYRVKNVYEKDIKHPQLRRSYHCVFDNQEQKELFTLDWIEWGQYAYSDQDRKTCEKFLDDNYPDWKDHFAYWE